MTGFQRNFNTRPQQSGYAGENNNRDRYSGGRDDRSYGDRDRRPSQPRGYAGERGYDSYGGYGASSSFPAPSTSVKAPKPEDLNNPARFITPAKAKIMVTLAIPGESDAGLLCDIESAYKSADIKNVYITPREGRNIIVAAPVGFVVPSEGMVAIRLLSKQAMKKLREI